MDLNRKFIFKHSQRAWTGVPIMAANMDTVGTFTMAEELSKHGVITCVHKHYTVQEVRPFPPTHPPTHLLFLINHPPTHPPSFPKQTVG